MPTKSIPIALGVKEKGSSPILRRGSWDDAVGELQTLLRRKGYTVAVHNELGAATELAVTQFQKKAGLTADGIVGEKT